MQSVHPWLRFVNFPRGLPRPAPTNSVYSAKFAQLWLRSLTFRTRGAATPFHTVSSIGKVCAALASFAHFPRPMTGPFRRGRAHACGAWAGPMGEVEHLASRQPSRGGRLDEGNPIVHALRLHALHSTIDSTAQFGDWVAANGWSRASRMWTTNLQIMVCYLGHDRPFPPSTELPNEPNQRLDVAKSRFIWSHTPESRNVRSPMPSDASCRRTSAWDVSRIRSDGNGCSGAILGQLSATCLFCPFSLDHPEHVKI